MARRSDGAAEEPAAGDAPRAESSGPGGAPKRAWTSVGVGVVLVVLLLIFIAQNTQDANVSFLGWDFSLPLAVTLLAAAATGAALVLLVGTIRVTQLRLAERRQRRAAR